MNKPTLFNQKVSSSSHLQPNSNMGEAAPNNQKSKIVYKFCTPIRSITMLKDCYKPDHTPKISPQELATNIELHLNQMIDKSEHMINMGKISKLTEFVSAFKTMEITRFGKDGDEESEHLDVGDQVCVSTEDTDTKRYLKIDFFLVVKRYIDEKSQPICIGEEFFLAPKEDPDYEELASGYLPFKKETKQASVCMASMVDHQVYLTPKFDEGEVTFSSFVLNHDLGGRRSWMSANPVLKTIEDKDLVTWKPDTKPPNKEEIDEINSHI